VRPPFGGLYSRDQAGGGVSRSSAFTYLCPTVSVGQFVDHRPEFPRPFVHVWVVVPPDVEPPNLARERRLP
jgi:hypothetical protein